MPVSYTHLDVYKRQTYRNRALRHYQFILIHITTDGAGNFQHITQISTAIFVRRRTAVSYTHLDVYKRQSIHNLAFYLWLVGEARKHIIAGDFSTGKPMMVKRVSTRL